MKLCACKRHDLAPYQPAPDGVAFGDHEDEYETHRLPPDECTTIMGYPISPKRKRKVK